MVLAHSSYAKAAGLQSEISRQTVGRVAGSEVEYKRQMNLYKKDMMITISNVRREERVLRKSMKRYSKKKRQNKIERRKREQEDLARDQRTQEHLNVLMVWRDNTGKTPSSENKHTSLPEHHNTELNDEIHKGHEIDKQTDDANLEGNGDGKTDNAKEGENHEKHANIKETDSDVQTYSSGVHLPAIVEDNEQELKEELENEKNDILLEREDSGFQELTVTPNESSVEAISAMSGFQLAIPQIKPKKQVVSYADIIKLQHTSNTKKLFNLVNLLAKKHGIAEQNKKPTEIRNSSVLRGSTNESWTDTMLRTGSVFYPMKYGYVTDPVEENSEDLSNGNTNLTNSLTLTQDGGTISENSVHKSPSNPSSKDATPLPPLTSRPNSQRVESQNATQDLTLSSKRMHKRNKSMPVLINDYNKIKKVQSENFSSSGDNKNSRHSTQSTPSAPRRLHPLNSFSSEKSDAVSWHEAFGLLKGVHTLNI